MSRQIRLLSLAAVVVVVARSSAFGESLRFDSGPLALEIPNDSTDLVLRDCDGDGRLDAIVALVRDEICVASSDAPCGFRETRTFVAGEGARPEALALGDFDRDGHIDVAVAKSHRATGGGASVAILKGDGAGNFEWVQNVRLPIGRTEGSTDAASADFDGDGHLDLAVTTWDGGSESRLYFLFGSPAGFVSAPIAHVTEERPTGIAVSDFDESGFPDVVVASARGASVLFRNDGAGRFGSPEPIAGVDLSWNVVTADFDRDGHADLAFTGDSPGVRVLTGDGTGSFGPPLVLTGGGGSMSVADLDDDGRLDIVAMNESPGQVVVFLGDGAGGFGSPAAFGSSGHSASAIAVGDWDRDGHADILTSLSTSRSPGFVIVYRGDGTGDFPSVRTYSTGPDPRRHVAADFDEDGALDVVTADYGDGAGQGGGISFLRGLGAAGFEPPASLETGLGASFPIAFDADSDGHADVAVVHEQSNDLVVLRGDGTGALIDARRVGLPGSGRYAAAADFDVDGNLDLAVAFVRAAGIGDGFVVYSGDGSGGFAQERIVTRFDSRSVAALDADSDGRPDLLLGSIDPDFGTEAILTIFRGDGAFGFLPIWLRQFSGSVDDLALADLNADGSLDIVTQSLDVFLSVGAPIGASTSGNGGALDVVDFDRDGNLDVLAAGFMVSLFRGDGNGGFLGGGEPEGIVAGSYLRSVLSIDVDGDARPDITAALATSEVSLLLDRTGDPDACTSRLGNVNAAAGPVADVLFVNGRKGLGSSRHLAVDRFALFQIRIKTPPADADGSARWAMFAWVGAPRPETLTFLPYGPIAMPPLAAKKTWNNTGNVAEFGEPDFASSPSPTLVIRRERGVKKRLTFYVQGVIEDAASLSGVYSVTNGIEIRSD